MSDERLGLRLWLMLRWWAFRAWLRHCPDCGRRGYDPLPPRWENDKTALMLGGVTPDRCPCCGRAGGQS